MTIIPSQTGVYKTNEFIKNWTKLITNYRNIVKHAIFISWAIITQYHKLGGLKQQKFIASQFWKLEVQNQGFYRALLPPSH